MNEIDDAIGRVEALYRSVTGNEAPKLTGPYAPIPAEQDPVQYVHEQMDRLSKLLEGAPESARSMQTSAWSPALSAWESKTETVLTVDLPGVTRSHLEVTSQGNMIIVVGQRQPRTAEGQELTATEAAWGIFRRVIPLPQGLDVHAMSASLKDGVLEIRIPRDTTKSATTARTIAVS